METSTSTPPNDPRDDLAAFGIGAADREESLAVKHLIAQDPALRREAAEYGAAAASLLTLVPRVAPPASLKNKILTAARASRPTVVPLSLVQPPTQRSQSTRILVWVAAAAAIALFGLNVFWITELYKMRDMATAMSVANADYTMAVALLTDSGSKRLELMDAEDGSMRAMVVWTPTHSEALMVTHSLPALDANHTYQLWMIGDDGPVSAGVFDTDSNGVHSMVFMPPLGWNAVDAVGISVEPPGGSVAPTTTPLAVGVM